MIYYVRRFSTAIATLSGLAGVIALLIARVHQTPTGWRVVAVLWGVFALAALVRIGVAITRPLWSGED